MKFKMFARSAGLIAAWILPHLVLAANVTVDMGAPISAVGSNTFGIHTSVYDNINQYTNTGQLPSRLLESGVNTLRYSGGGYADVFHWSICRASWENGITGGGLSPWWGQAGNYGYVASKTDFGNFVKLLDYMGGGKALITVNYGSALKFVGGQSLVPDYGGQPKEAAAWVAYANANASIYGTANDIVIGVDEQGNNWKTAGYWARLRASTPAQYQTWATADGVYDSYNSFLAINRPAPVGIKYWEIGNETFGTAYYDQADTTVSGETGYSENMFAPYSGVDRRGHPNLSPAFYGQKVNEFAAAMKAVDPTIRIGTVLSTPPDDYYWDYYQRYDVNDPYNEINGPDDPDVKHWNAEVLSQCATNTDFVIAHWYPWIGDGSTGSNLMWFVRTKLPLMINGSTAGLDTGGDAGLKDWINLYRPADGTNVEIFITEFGYFGSLAASVLGPGNALFAGDAYATWMDLGVANIDYLEMNKTPFLGDNESLTRGAVFYAIQMVRKMAGPADTLIRTTSDQSLLRAHAALRQDNKLGLLLVNQSRTSNQTVNVTVTNASLTSSGTRYQFGTNNFPVNDTPSSGPSSNSVSGLGNSFSVTVPAYTIVVLTIPLVSNTPPTLAAISNRTVNVGQTVAFTASATDTNQPPQTLTFTLLNGPTNATVNCHQRRVLLAALGDPCRFHQPDHFESDRQRHSQPKRHSKLQRDGQSAHHSRALSNRARQ